MDKNLDNANTRDALKTSPKIKVVGNPDVWELICKASGESWMKSTKRMWIYDPVLESKKIGYHLQVTSEFRDEDGNVTSCAEALTTIRF